MSQAGARQVNNAQLALICGAFRLARMDPETEEHKRLLDDLLHLVSFMSFETALIGGAAVSLLCYKLVAYASALDGMVSTASGERDWRPVYLTEADLRQEADDCLRQIYERARDICECGRASRPAVA